VQGVFDVHAGAYDGGGASSDPSPSEATIDAAACPDQGSASLTGSFLGATLSAKDAIEVFDAVEDKYTFEITDYAGACSLGNNVHASSNVVAIVYEKPMLSSSTYDVTQTAGLSVGRAQYDATCKASKSDMATSGTVTFTDLGTCSAKGSFDLVFGTDHVTATFTASVCSVPNDPPACH
jgi:hypothetical protein